MKTKKGQAFAGLQGVVITLVTIAIVLIIGFLVFSETKTVVKAGISSSSVTNESFTFATNTTYIALTYSTNAIQLTCNQVVNGTAPSGVVVGSGNYTCTAGKGILLTNESLSTWTSPMMINYTYKEADAAWNSTSEVQNATSDLSGWLPIFVIVIIGGLLIGLVAMFRRKT